MLPPVTVIRGSNKLFPSAYIHIKRYISNIQKVTTEDTCPPNFFIIIHLLAYKIIKINHRYLLDHFIVDLIYKSHYSKIRIFIKLLYKLYLHATVYRIHMSLF